MAKEQGRNVQDVGHFRKLLELETNKLSNICKQWEAKITPELQDQAGDDICGRIRAAVGKARILMDRKGRFPQFKQLIDNCEFGYGEKETTCMDLQGFWEMIYFQVEDILKCFSGLSQLETNHWREPSSKTGVKTKTIKPLCRPKEVAVKRSASVGLRALMAAKRREMNRAKNPEPKITIEVTEEQPSETEDKVFEGGFFRVTSPNTQRKSPTEDRFDGYQIDAAFQSIHLTPRESSVQSKSASLPSSTHVTPNKGEDSVRRSLLDSASRRLATSAANSMNQTPFAIMRVTSACRRSMGRENDSEERPSSTRNIGGSDFKMTLNFDEKENEETVKHDEEPLRRSARLLTLKDHNQALQLH